MNLYRNFGALLEAWVTESPSIEGLMEVADQVTETPTFSERAFREDSQMLFKSESEDSGLEETPATPQGLEQSFSLAKDSHHVEGGSSSLPAPPPPSCLDPCNQSHFIVEQALKRTKWVSFEGNRKAFCSPFTNSWTVPTLICQRSGELEAPATPMQTAQPSKPEHCQQEPTPKQEGPEISCNGPAFRPTCTSTLAASDSGLDSVKHKQLEMAEDKLQHQEEDYWESLHLSGPSFGLTYLGRVCRLLEEIAKLKARNQKLEREIERIQQQQRRQVKQDLMSSHFSCSDRKTGCEEPELERCVDHFSQSSFENMPSFQQSSMSDTHVIQLNTGGLKKLHWSGSAGNFLTEADNGSQSTAQKGKATHAADNIKRTTWKKRDKQNKDSDSEPTSTSEGQKSSQHLRLLFKKKSKKKSSS